MAKRLFKWLGLAAGVVALLAAAFWLYLAPPSSPDEILFHGGDVVTVTGSTEEALLIRGGRIVAVGPLATVEAAASGSAIRVDLEGRALLPGLIEPHTHPIATAQFGAAVDVSGFTHSSRASIIAALKEAAEGWQPTGWVVAFGWDPVMVDDLEPPTLAELDAISPDRPLMILTQMMHDAYVNSRALEAAGITRDTPNPPGGEFLRDSTGALTGTVREIAALKAISSAMPTPPEGATDLLVNLELAHYARAGFTTIAAAGLVGNTPAPVALMKRLAAHTQAPVQVSLYGLPHQLPDRGGPEAATLPAALIGVKFWMDGSPYAGGAAFAEPYETSELTTHRLHLHPGHMGPINYDADTFADLFEQYHTRGYQVAVHVQGERAADRVLDTVEAVLARHPRADHRHRLEHNALITKAQLARAASLGMTTSFFVDHVTFYGHRLPELVGERTNRYMPVKSALEAGLKVSLHSDNPATPIGPLRTLKAAVTRQPRRGGPKVAAHEAISREAALRAMTIDAAWQLGLEGERGSLEAGKAADLVLMSENPLTADLDRLDGIEVIDTWIAGRRVDTRQATRTNAGLLLDTLGAMF